MNALDVSGLSIGYGNIAVVHDLDLQVGKGEMVALLGPNGAGKTTTMLGIAGVLHPLAGSGTMSGEPLSGPLHQRARRGMALLTEGKSVFRSLTVADNLKVGGGSVDDAVGFFPELERLLGRSAGMLSGGEQQMLALARALASHPKVLLVDELSLGLAPIIVDRLLAQLRVAADDGLAVLLVEQQARKALAASDRAYVLRRGRVRLEGDSAELLADFASVEKAYLGDAEPVDAPASEPTPAKGA